MVSLLLKMWLLGSGDIGKVVEGVRIVAAVTSTRFGTVWRRQKFINLITIRRGTLLILRRYLVIQPSFIMALYNIVISAL